MTAIHGTREDLLWLAGLLEGEGCFDLQKGTYPRIRLSMTDRDVVGRAASLMDTGVRLSIRHAPNKSTWHAELQGERAAAIMEELLPYMGARRSQRIADSLGVFRARHIVGGPIRAWAVPGPKITRPFGVAKPVTAA